MRKRIGSNFVTLDGYYNDQNNFLACYQVSRPGGRKA